MGVRSDSQMVDDRRITGGRQLASSSTHHIQRKAEPPKPVIKNLKQIDTGLTSTASETAKRIHEIANNIDLISRLLLDSNTGESPAAKQLEKIKTDFTRLVDEVRQISKEGGLQIRNTLDTVSICLSSGASAEQKDKEFKSLQSFLTKFSGRAIALSTRLKKAHDDIVSFTRNWPLGNTEYPQEIPSKLSIIKNGMGYLIDREFSIDATLKLKLDNSVVGIVRALVVFLPMDVYEKLVLSVEKVNALKAHPENPRSGNRENLRLNVLDTLINVGKILDEDIADMQRQSDASAFMKKFIFLNDLYNCLGTALDCFSIACAVRQDTGVPLLKLCTKDPLSSTMATDLPSPHMRYPTERAAPSGRTTDRRQIRATGSKSTGIVGFFKRIFGRNP